MTYLIPLKYLPAAAVVISLAACSSSSDPAPDPEPLASQAVDGYIVEADVSCDDVARGKTRAAGFFTCPAGTMLSRVSGGYDVGIDTVATTGTVPFTGVLTAPATAEFVTPLTTLAVALALDGQSTDGEVDLSGYNAAKSTLARALGIQVATLSQNPVATLGAAQANAKVHQVLAAFAPNKDVYEEATSAFAAVIARAASGGDTLDLTSNVSVTMTAINGELIQSSSTLRKSTVDLDQAAANVATANITIDAAESPAKVAAESQKALIDQAPVTIDRVDATVTLSNANQTANEQLSIAEFESPIQTGGMYNARLFSGMTYVSYDKNVFQFNQNINDTQVTIGFEIKSVNAGDQRSLSVSSNAVKVSAIKGDPASLEITTVSPDSRFTIHGTDAAGVVTKAVFQNNGQTFRTEGDKLTINLEKINQQLSDLKFEDILATDGDYSVTLVIKGLRINEQDGNVTKESKEFTVKDGDQMLTGNGFRGYVSVIR
ncbi:MAG: hypothetical protein AB8B97_22455 [Granulosicoccus sp.]